MDTGSSSTRQEVPFGQAYVVPKDGQTSVGFGTKGWARDPVLPGGEDKAGNAVKGSPGVENAFTIQVKLFEDIYPCPMKR